MITRHAWGDIWTRPGLPHHPRRLVTTAMLIGINRTETAPQGGEQHRCDPRRDQGSADAERHLLWHSGHSATFHLAEEVWDALGVESHE